MAGPGPQPGGHDLSAGGHDLSAGGGVLDQVAACARAALRLHGCHPDASAELISVSENATFLVSDPDAGPSVLRVHRLGYHTQQEIESELAWMEALRAEAGVRTPRVLPAADGRRVVTAARTRRRGTAYGLSSCPAPSRADRPGGRLPGGTSRSSARSPRGCTGTPGPGRGRPGSPGSTGTGRPRSGRRPRWGRWQDGIGVGPAERAGTRPPRHMSLRTRLAAFGPAGALRPGARRHPAGQPACPPRSGEP